MRVHFFLRFQRLLRNFDGRYVIRMNCGVEKIYNFGSIYAVGLFLVVLCVYCVFGCGETLFEVFSTWVFLFFGRTFLWKRSPWHRRLPYLLNWVDWVQKWL